MTCHLAITEADKQAYPFFFSRRHQSQACSLRPFVSLGFQARRAESFQTGTAAHYLTPAPPFDKLRTGFESLRVARDAEGRRAYIDRIDPPSPSELRRGRQDRHDLSSAFPEEKSRDDVYALIGAAAMGGGEHINNSTFFINLIEETPRTNPVSPCIGMPAL